jgi:radical SAM protein with 4Fe4S-binding SPASM domain
MSDEPISYGNLVRDLHDRAAAARQPINGVFELTAACNFACRMCYVRQPGSQAGARGNELSAAQWLEIAREAKKSGLIFLLLTGGEVFLRRDFFDIYEPLAHMGLMITIFTNGALVTPEIARRLAKAPPSRIEITLYGTNAATYKAVTGVAGGFEDCCAGIESLIAHRVPLALKTTLVRDNASQLDEMRRMALDWGVTMNGAWALSRRRDGKASDVEDCRLSGSECVELEATDAVSVNEMREAALARSPQAENFYCKAGRAAFAINPKGEMNACLLLPRPAVKPLEIGFAAAWAEVNKYVDAASEPSPVCRACDAHAFCGRCPAWSLIETGTPAAPVPYWCEIAQARKSRYSTAALTASAANRP